MELVFFLIVAVASTGQSEAAEQATRAYAKQVRIDEMLDRYMRRLVHEDYRIAIGNTALLTRVVIERQVILKWEF